MELKTTNKEVIEEVPWGMYVWQTPDGEVLGDDDGNVMNVFCQKGNREAIKKLADAARYYGFAEGKAVWWSGRRRVTDEELEEQQMRQRWGLVADPLDVGALRDEALARKNDRT